ncbi:MAG: hypothetical protein V7724_13960 [Sediminicola sp.]
MQERSKKRISPEDAQRMLREEGVEVSLELAEEVLWFLRKMANIVVRKYLENGKDS